MKHPHHAWLQAVADDVENEYQLVSSTLKGPSNTQQRGHYYEALFRRLLVGWLPPQYEIGTRKYLVLEAGKRQFSGETDLVIFHPSYPHGLRQRSEVLVSGVVAAFSVKSALTTKELKDAVDEARKVREGIARRVGSVVGEVVSPLIYGVLAHTSAIRSMDPQASVSRVLRAEMQKREDPRRQLDIVCISDLDCWYRTVQILAHEVATREPSEYDIYIDFWRAASQSAELTQEIGFNPNPIATLMTQLWAKLAIRDSQLSPIADALRMTGTGEYGGIGVHRPLTDLVSPDLHRRLLRYHTTQNFPS